MTIDEAVHRVARQHWILILACMILPTLVTVVLASRSGDIYQAVGRIQLGRQVANSAVEADAMSQRALGIATSQGVVQAALDKAGLHENPSAFARAHVSVERVGVSPVVEIGVTDASPQRAATMAASISADVIQFSNLGDRQQVEERRAELGTQLNTVTEQREALIARLKSASPGEVLVLQAQLSGLLASQTGYERQLSDLSLAAVADPTSVLLDPVRTPSTPLPSDLAQRAVIAMLIGTLLGLGAAATVEMLRPTLGSPEAIAGALGTTHVGDIPGRDLAARPSVAAMSEIADRLALLGHRYRAERVFLGPVREADDIFCRLVAESLGPARSGTEHRLTCAVLDDGWVEPTDHPVAVVLTPRRIRAKELGPIVRLVSALGWPLIGLVTYAPDQRPLNPSGRRVRIGQRGARSPMPGQQKTVDGGQFPGGGATNGVEGQAASPPSAGPAPKPREGGGHGDRVSIGRS